MEKNEKRIMIRNLGKGTHIFGAAFVHPNGDTSKQPECVCPLIQLGPKGAPNDKVELTVDQFKFYDDESLRAKVDSREYAVYVDGKDIRPDLARKEGPAPATVFPATEPVENVEQALLAEILASGDPKPE